jgi:hypothetical protein
MAFEFIQPDAISSSANLDAWITVGQIDNITDANFTNYDVNNGQSISPSTDPDGSFLTADGNGPTNVTVSFPNPSQGTGELVGIQTAFCIFRRQTSSNPPQEVAITLTVLDNGVSVANGSVINYSQAESVETVVRVNWNTGGTITDGTNITFQASQTAGGAGGNPGRRGFVEYGEIVWIAQLRDPLIYDPFNWGEII